ncbi:MAG: sulfite reductase [Chlamydiia bacterium]|nr:sulfite reductase [Chlamydiia bacterium]
MSIKTYSKSHPFLAHIQERTLLTGHTSTKQTYHIALTIHGTDFPFKPGDSIAVLPQNDPQEVEDIIQNFKINAHDTLFDPRTNAFYTAYDYLIHQANIRRLNTSFFKELLSQTAPQDPILSPENKTRLNDWLPSRTLLDLSRHYPLPNLSALAKLMPLLPRFYSIASSSLVFPNEIHLLVAYVSYTSHGHFYKGIGSHFLCTFAKLHTTPIPIYLQPSHNFSLPKDPAASMILVGPGTGVAPFRAFLQERIATHAPGRNWLFFGERNRATDFYYEPFWLELQSQGRLRLSLTFSRDTPEKIYVQHKLYTEKKSVWDWLESGSSFYVCGDAGEMAKDVDLTLHRILREEGNLTEEAAYAYVRRLKTENRYLIDVY